MENLEILYHFEKIWASIKQNLELNRKVYGLCKELDARVKTLENYRDR